MNTNRFLCLVFCVGLTNTQSATASLYTVTVDTSAIQGKKGAIVFEFTSQTRFINTVTILNFQHNGTTGLPETEGGLVTGDIILLSNPAPFTEIATSQGLFFNELVLPFSSFGTSVSFSLQLTENGPALGILPDEFSFFILGENRLPLFPTSDPLGADALFAICIDGSATGFLSVFTPTTFISPDSLNIPVPAIGDSDSDRDGVPDVVDDCDNSDLAPTVMINGCDSGVKNTLLGNGCTIADRIAECRAQARNHGQFVSCIAHLVADLGSQGLVSLREQARIKRCAALADFP